MRKSTLVEIVRQRVGRKWGEEAQIYSLYYFEFLLQPISSKRDAWRIAEANYREFLSEKYKSSIAKRKKDYKDETDTTVIDQFHMSPGSIEDCVEEILFKCTEVPYP